MRNVISFCAIGLVATMLSGPATAADDGLVAHWNFDDVTVEYREVRLERGKTFIPKQVFSFVEESVSGTKNDLEGKFYKLVPGVKGQALRLDGYTAYVNVKGGDEEEDEEPEGYLPRVSGPFSVESWIALGAYPKHWCPIVDHQRDVAEGYFNGYFFGLDAMGRVMFRIATNGKNEELISSDTLPLNTWFHLAGVYTPEEGMKIYVNGELAGAKKLDSEFRPARRTSTLLVGKSRTKHRPYGTIRPEGTMESFTFLDGIIDELKIYDRALDYNEIAQSFSANKPTAKPDLPPRILPAGPKGPSRFGAINTTLKYYDAWDAPWHVAEAADVVVRFDESPCRFVFWRGTSYIPTWVTENGIWFSNAFDEGWNEHGSCEPMSDKRTLNSFVKIVESNDARVVVQWRYGLVDVLGNFAFQDPATGWGDFANETYTIYPDMIGVRDDKLLSNAPNAAHEWQESMMVMGPGQRPDEVLELAALSLANIEGETYTYSWEHKTPPYLPKDPPNASIQVVNTQSKYRPFSIIRPQDKPRIDIYAGEVRRDVCVFPWWNHWPVAPRATDGRYAMFSDRASHASLSHWNWEAYETTPNSMTKIMLTGVTTEKVGGLLPLAKSWSNPAKLNVQGDAFASDGYNPKDRAYHLSRKQSGEPSELAFELSASEDSPIVNLAVVVNDWGYNDAELTLNGKEIERGKDFRFGHRERLDGTDLIVWVRTESTDPVQVTLSPVTN